MKHFFMTLVTLLAFTSFSHAQDSTQDKVSEQVDQSVQDTTEKAKDMEHKAKMKAKKAGRDAKRTAKRGMHRAEEAACMDGDLKCAAKKTKNRVEEGKDSTVDTIKDTKEQMSK